MLGGGEGGSWMLWDLVIKEFEGAVVSRGCWGGWCCGLRQVLGRGSLKVTGVGV